MDCLEIESSIAIKLKSLSQRLINNARLKKHFNTSNRKRSTIVTIVKSNIEESDLYNKNLGFIVCLAEPSLVFLTCSSIRHNFLEI